MNITDGMRAPIDEPVSTHVEVSFDDGFNTVWADFGNGKLEQMFMLIGSYKIYASQLRGKTRAQMHEVYERIRDGVVR